ncbi:Rieske (2Fe-2S) protein [Halorientalis salina]|uniref:Rieske (2Fe-2S) protein n=1 Tax=Halorientalis salina TaxID=2932266 RepID=UPI0010ABE075|nr:Rieske (2Fe-2S) protein [Halorientalis salina]
MSEPVRVTVSTDDETESVRVYDDAGRVDAGSASFSFSFDGAESSTATESAAAGGQQSGDDPTHVAPLSEVPINGTMRCEGLADDRGTEFILRREGDAVVAWRNSCPHKPEVRLDPGHGALVTDKHLVCHEHGARFVRGDGQCSSGPCQGAALAPIEVSVEDGDVYLTDDRFDACCVF